MPPRKRHPLDRQVLGVVKRPALINPKDWDLVVCIRLEDGAAQVIGRRTRLAGKALRIVAAETERWEEP